LILPKGKHEPFCRLDSDFNTGYSAACHFR
jgi:hypothetical protein